MQSRAMIACFSISFFIISCSDVKSHANSEGTPFSTETRNLYQKLGEAGYGDAYTVLANQADIYGIGEDSAVYQARAINTNGSQANLRYATLILEEAKLLPDNSVARGILLQEARNRVELSIRNAYLWIDNDRIDSGRRTIVEAQQIINEIESEM